jgi:hypothetical protein
VTFKDGKKGKVLGTDVIKVNNNFTVKGIILVEKLRYNLLSISQLVDVDLDILFHKSGSKVLDSRGDLICVISRMGKLFQADFSFSQPSMKCLIAQSSSKLWKWHMRLGHLSFNLLYRLSSLGLLRELPLYGFLVIMA